MKAPYLLSLILLVSPAGCSDDSAQSDGGTSGGDSSRKSDGTSTSGDGPTADGSAPVDAPVQLDGFPAPKLQIAFPNLKFTRPVDLVFANDGTNRAFVVEQGGRIRVFTNSKSTSKTKVFLDISSKVVTGGEQGLLALAFHPRYKSNGYFYVNYTAPNPRRTIVARYQVSSTDADKADASSELVLVTRKQPFANHNGGCTRFGPDGKLYVGFGDGGDANDPGNVAQDRSSLLGSLIRIDVDHTQGGKNYAIPSDNPFAGNKSGWREEIWAWGLRNPWRFSWDPRTDKLWVGDVGQNAWEEIDIVAKGKNYGWKIMEGKVCRPGGPSNCNKSGLELPIWVYANKGGASITGGHVYRGKKIPGLYGTYVYADAVSGRVWKLRYENGKAQNELIEDTSYYPSSLAVDKAGELYMLDLYGGRIIGFVPGS